MARLRYVVLGAAIACSPAAPRPVGPPAPSPIDAAVTRRPPTPPPDLRLPTAVAPRGYRLELDVDPARADFGGRVTIDLEVGVTTDVVWLHADELAIDRATIERDGAAIAVELVTDAPGQRVGLWTATPLPPGAARVTLAYRGTVTTDDEIGLFRQRTGGQPYLFTQHQGIFARRVAPCFDEPAWKVPWQITVRAPSGLVVAANTPERSRRVDGDAVVVEFAPSPPIPSYLVAVAVGPFDVVEVGAVGRAAVPTRILTPAGRRADAAAAMAAVPPLVADLETYFDRPLPLTKLDLVAVPRFFGAMENLGLVTFAATTLLHTPERATDSDLRGMRSVIAHELAHQWFGDLVTPRWWDDLWLNESFATWMADKITAAADPDFDPLLAHRASLDRAMRLDALPSARPLRRPIAGGLDVDDSFDAIAYDKGGALLVMLERQLGSERMRAGIRAYLTTHADGNASAADFLTALAAVSAPEVAPAFATFLDHPGVPAVTLDATCDATAATATITAAVADPRGVAPWRLPLCVRFPDPSRRVTERCVTLPPGGGTLVVPGCPRWLVGNPDGVGYYRVDYAPAWAQALLTHVAELTVSDRFTRAADLAAHVRAGIAPASELVRWIDALLTRGTAYDRLAAARLAEVLDAHVTAALRPRWQRFVRQHFVRQRVAGVARARRATGARPTRLADRAAHRQLRALAALGGRDPAATREATRAVTGWLDGGADPGDDRESLLVIALDATPALRPRVVAALAAAPVDVRDDLVAALAAQTDAASRADNRALFLSGTLDAATALPLVTDALGTDADAAAWAELTAAYPTIIARLSPLEQPDVVTAARARCSATAATEVATFFAPHAAADPRIALELPAVLDAIDACAAERARIAPQLDGVLP